jgi:hypothetical protein
VQTNKIVGICSSSGLEDCVSTYYEESVFSLRIRDCNYLGNNYEVFFSKIRIELLSSHNVIVGTIIVDCSLVNIAADTTVVGMGVTLGKKLRIDIRRYANMVEINSITIHEARDTTRGRGGGI